LMKWVHAFMQKDGKHFGSFLLWFLDCFTFL